VAEQQEHQRGALVTTSELLVVAAMLLPFFSGRDVLAGMVGNEESRRLIRADGSKSISTLEASIARNVLGGKIFFRTKAPGAAVVFASGLARPKMCSHALEFSRSKPHFYRPSMTAGFSPGNGEVVDPYSLGMSRVNQMALCSGGSRCVVPSCGCEARNIQRFSANVPSGVEPLHGERGVMASLVSTVGPVLAKLRKPGRI
jgi:hypothetical protein